MKIKILILLVCALVVSYFTFSQVRYMSQGEELRYVRKGSDTIYPYVLKPIENKVVIKPGVFRIGVGIDAGQGRIQTRLSYKPNPETDTIYCPLCQRMVNVAHEEGLVKDNQLVKVGNRYKVSKTVMLDVRDMYVNNMTSRDSYMADLQLFRAHNDSIDNPLKYKK